MTNDGLSRKAPFCGNVAFGFVGCQLLGSDRGLSIVCGGQVSSSGAPGEQISTSEAGCNVIIRIALSLSLPIASFSNVDDPRLQIASGFAE